MNKIFIPVVVVVFAFTKKNLHTNLLPVISFEPGFGAGWTDKSASMYSFKSCLVRIIMQLFLFW